ncbi:sensor histidine kinase [Citreimonas sp.]|uniref:sensor histidine kinase n=1 Tax=Citreimonas sp. TaxID=3036715 RepID=UPI0035C7D5D2
MTDPGLLRARETGYASRRRRDSLLMRVALLLTLALLPIGIVVIAQTWRAMENSSEIFANTLLAQTSAIVAPEREAIHTTIGVAQTLAGAFEALEPDMTGCEALLARTARDNPRLAFIGLVRTDMIARCNTTDEIQDFSNRTEAIRMFETVTPSIMFNARGAVSDQPVIVVSEPVMDPQDGFVGYIVLSFPVAGLGFDAAAEPDQQATVVTFNQAGEILTSSGPETSVGQNMPLGVALRDLVGSPPVTFEAPTPGGEERVFAVAPIVPGRAYALGSWSPVARGASGSAWFLGATLGFPLIMWAVTMLVALLALNQLVLRHVNALGRRMRSFADIRRIYRPADSRHAPTEIRDIDDAFERMATQIIRDEADLENSLREREILLKEVHHRVKNNLQLMSSIINMQVRKIGSDEARYALRQFQDRVASLASVHQALYQEPSLTRLRVDVLLGDIVAQLATMGSDDRGGADLVRELDPVTLMPDQAGPLAMLATEAVVNAFKYGGPDETGTFRILVKLALSGQGDDRRATLTIENTVSAEKRPNDGTGLGRQLIAAFASQLEARLEEESREDRFIVRVTFAPAPFEPSEDEPAPLPEPSTPPTR